jgi:hypothetical protein
MAVHLDADHNHKNKTHEGISPSSVPIAMEYVSSQSRTYNDNYSREYPVFNIEHRIIASLSLCSCSCSNHIKHLSQVIVSQSHR